MRTAPTGVIATDRGLAASVKRALGGWLPHPVYRIYRKQRVGWQVRRFSPRIVGHIYSGHQLSVLLADPLSEGWYDHDWPRLREFDELSRVGALAPGARVFDLGAHQAVVALALAREVGASGSVVAVEAEPHNAATAIRNVELNAAENVTVVHAAIADYTGTTYFAESLNGHVDARTSVGNVEVQAVTVDRLAEQFGPPDLVFLDVEGYEGKALRGAAATLGSGRTCFFIEVHAKELVDCTVEDVLACFDGYTVSVAEPLPTGEAGVFGPMTDPPKARRFFMVAAPNRFAGSSAGGGSHADLRAFQRGPAATPKEGVVKSSRP